MLLMTLLLRIVVRRLRVFVHVHAGEALHALAMSFVVRVREALEQECAHAFAGVEPVGLRDEFLVVGAVLGELGQFVRSSLYCFKWPS